MVEVTADQCDRCGSTNSEECGVEKEVIEEIPPPPKIEVIQFNWHKYQCQDCGHEFTAKHEECPQKGKFGVNLLVYLTRLKFSLRGVLRRIKDFASHLNSFGITPKSIQDAILRVGEACNSAYFRNGLGDWYTCLLYPGMKPTNNHSEQVIREHVLMRKIIQAFSI